jgi:hypothetical protein
MWLSFHIDISAKYCISKVALGSRANVLIVTRSLEAIFRIYSVFAHLILETVSAVERRYRTYHERN